MATWHSLAPYIDTFEIDICFLIFPEFDLKVRLPDPGIPRQDDSLVRSTEAVGYAEALAKYYQVILARAKRNRMTFNEIRHFFWLRLFLWNTQANVHLTFPWYDTYAEITYFLDRVKQAGDGELFWDIDQSWELTVDLEGGILYFREWNPDDETIHQLVALPQQQLIEQIPPLQARIESIAEQLTAVTGLDIWAKYRI